ncbi:ligand-dependent nuclear receptor-interacting factor 1 isoform X5 [Pipistrellus kuhlii]|nr:ligand-dependent nuclear receptor-interacting factor 1 isoform X5 [Pipistrellus kuhlii]XP_045442859.1 ligand-dependent nuclear receptor-interacting factor 1 isoform X5 [Pipistrellus kuhlii]KAF6304835.1 ligand dependent nuclear receptor interacting factor 1 [Pipistrellus kuhlii]
MASTLQKDAQERNDKKNSQGSSSKAHLKTDAEFKKLFGLTKDLRIRLTRIPDHLGAGDFDSFRNLVKSDKETKFTVKEEEKKQYSTLQQGFDKKRKAKTVKKMDRAKKRKIESAYNTAINGGISCILPASDVSHHSIITNCNKTREERTEVEHCTSENQEKVALSSHADFGQSHSFTRNYTEDIFPMRPPELEETIRDEKIRRLKQMLREKEAALEEMRKKMHQK